MHPWKPGEVEEVFHRSGGPGGQNVNKVETGVTLRHIPTGTCVRCTTSRSQSKNRELAAALLAEKLEELAERKRQQGLAAASRDRRRRARRSKGTKRRLVEGKRRRAETKKMRGRVQS